MPIKKKDSELAWAAGLFEGEGCIHYHKRSDRNAMGRALTVAMTDEDVVRRFHEIVGCGQIHLYKQKIQHHNPYWRWECSRYSEIASILKTFLPYLGRRRKAKALMVLADPAQRNEEKTHCKWGHPFSGENLYVYPNGKSRGCRACTRASNKRRRQDEH